VVLRRVHSLIHSFPTRRIPRASLNPHHQLVRQISLYHILCQTVSMSAHGCTVFMGGRSTNRSLDLGMMTTTSFWSPLDKTLNCQNPPNIVSFLSPKSLFSILTGKQGTSIPGDNVEKIRYYYATQTQTKFLAWLSSSTQKNLTILLYGVSKE
jgi:hypothetical protein